MIHSKFDNLLGRALEQLSVYLKGYSAYIDRLLFKQRLQKGGVQDAESILTWTSTRELRALYDLASALPQGAAALEIGSYLGASTCHLATGLAEVSGHLFCVDTWSNETMPEGIRDTFAKFEENTRGVRSYITPIRKKSSELTLADIRVPLDLVFIDGDHSYSAVKSDFEHIQNWLAQNGIVAFHDFSNSDYEGVTRVVGEALASGQWMIMDIRDRLVWIKRATWSTPSWLEGC